MPSECKDQEKVIPVEVPSKYIKDEKVDYDGEIFSCLGGGITIGDLIVKAPSLGVFSLLETFESKFIADPKECSPADVMRVLFVNEKRAQCVQLVAEWIDDGKEDGGLFDATAIAFCESVGVTVEDIERNFVRLIEWFSLAFSGFRMIPGSGGGGAYLFGADTIGSMYSVTHLDMQSMLWDIPVVAIGHIAAAYAKQNGTEGVSRPKDKDDMKAQFEAARERIRKGELHPWQYAHPKEFPPSKAQMDHCGDIMEKYKKVLEDG